MQCSTAPSKIFSYALLLLSYVSINFSALIIRIWLDGMVVHPPQATKKEHGILVLNVPCSFCPLLQHFFYIEVNPSFQRPPESASYTYNRYSGQVQSILCSPHQESAETASLPVFLAPSFIYPQFIEFLTKPKPSPAKPFSFTGEGLSYVYLPMFCRISASSCNNLTFWDF